MDMFSNLIQIITQLSSLLLGGAFIILVAIIAFFAYKKGLLQKRDYKLIILTKRSSGGIKVNVASGRFMKNGKFEVAYSAFDKVEVAAPQNEAIHEGKIVFGISESREDAFWVNDLEIDDKKLKFEPTLNEGMKIAYVKSLEAGVLRLTKKNKWKEMAVPATLVICFLLFGMTLWFSVDRMAGSFSESTKQIVKQYSAISESLKEAELHIVKTPVSESTIEDNEDELTIGPVKVPNG